MFLARLVPHSVFVGLATLIFVPSTRAATLQVGPGKRFAGIEQAYADAKPSDVILVHPLKDGRAYERVAVQVRKSRLTFRAAGLESGARVKIDGRGYNYSGSGRVPRAIFQFNADADGCVLEGFELTGASNNNSNGAGVRINQASQVTVRYCEIHHNDMGIMSNGDGSLKSAMNQVIEHCVIHHNGNERHAGYNHNLYLGGTSVTLRFCDLHSPLTGQNVKSRAHYNHVEYSYIHHSANREFDLVHARETAYSDSHAVLLGNIIVKDTLCRGNKGVIHFGAEGDGQHDGTLYLVQNTIVTPFITPVIDLSASKAKAKLYGNLIHGTDRRQSNQVLASARNGASLAGLSATNNWIADTFSNSLKSQTFREQNRIAKSPAGLFANPREHDFHLTRSAPIAGADASAKIPLKIPNALGVKGGTVPFTWQYKHPADKQLRKTENERDFGALEFVN
ncbi:MAG: right-handed parallel beta-helix repeat-containing protein [Pirellulaceae bacterium]|jgi:hypothetical protein|nr:hypothetical protein [Planctomycetaceae bacterium]MDP6722303.1 right-handed parallel beta-helix repeat-containing protein [Pirellulaceae bacterium]